MSSVVALVSVITSAAVAISVPILSAHLERARGATQLRLARLDEFRAVADAASLALARAEEALHDADLAVELSCKRGADPERSSRADAALEHARVSVSGVHQALHRTAVRLGWSSSPATVYGAAHHELEAELQTLHEVYAGGPSADNADAWSEVTVALHEVRQRYEAHRTDFYESLGHLIGPAST